MNRTRFVFFAVLAICLAILAASLAGRLIGETRLLQLFIACSVFGIGVVALDFFGVLGAHHDGGDGGHDFAVQDLAGHGLGGHDLGGHDFGHTGGDHGDGGGPHHAGHEDHAADEEAGAALRPVHAGSSGAAPILSVLAYLRLFVYFCLGFGPAGWVALASGNGWLLSLAIATPAGLLSLFAARAFFRFQRRDTGAVASPADLLREEATVLIPLTHDTMGKVRVRAGLSVSDVYALAADPQAAFQRGDTVRIVDVTEDCVHVR